MNTIGARLLRFSERVREGCERNAFRIVLVLVVVFVVFFAGIAVVKFGRFGYNGLDLAIYTQAFHESARGNLFGLTIHPHPYLGDHVELILLALLPFYALVQRPETLVILQTVILASGALAVFAIARQQLTKTTAMLLALTYLLNPTIQNIALFEFHALPVAIPLLLWTVFAYLTKRFWLFLAFLGLSLIVREDVSLVMVGIGLLALFERRRWHWWLLPILLGLGWFVVSLRISGHFSGYGQYKFLRYYAWLGESIPEIFRNIFLHPLRWLERLFSVRSLELALGTLLPVSALPLLRPRWLVPTIPIFLQLALLAAPGEILLQIHYPSLLLPFLFVALIFAIQGLATPGKTRLMKKISAARTGIIAFLPLASLYFAIVLGPLWSAPRQLFAGVDREDLRLQNRFVRMIPKDASLATTFEPLQKVAQRPRIYSLSYVFLGRKQFSEEPYELPEGVTHVLIDLDDLIRFDLIYPETDYRGRRGYERIRAVLDRGFVVTAREDHLLLLERREGAAHLPVARAVELPPTVHERELGAGITILGWTGSAGDDRLLLETGAQGLPRTVLPLSLYATVREPVETDFELAFRLFRDGREVYETYYPVASGLFPTSAWVAKEAVRQDFRFRIPETLPPGSYEARMAFLELQAHVDVDGLRSIEHRLRIEEEIKPEVSLGTVTVPEGRTDTR